MRQQVKISVITVCYNAENCIRKTIESVLRQSYAEIEYLIIDGRSEDKTLEIVQSIAEKDSRVCCLSEPDEGLYDAMNKGVELSRGDYIYFLNAGDVFCDDFVIEEVVKRLGDDKADITYGDIMYLHPDGKKERRNYSAQCAKWYYYLTGDCINHQAMFCAKRCFEDCLFDLSYQICADREWMMRQSRLKRRFRKIDLCICVYSLDEDSISVKNRKLSDREAIECVKKHYKPFLPVLYCFNLFRNNKILSRVLHSIYRMLYINHS